LKTMSNMEMENIFGKIKTYTRVNLSIIKNKERADFKEIMEIIIKVIGLMIKFMGMVHL